MSKWLKVNEAAEYLRCPVEKVMELLALGRIRHSMATSEPLFLQEWLDEFVLREVSPKKRDRRAKAPPPCANIRCDVDKSRVLQILDWLEAYNDGCEIFVNSLGAKLRKDILARSWRELEGDLFARLSRWCHPRKRSPRNDAVQKKARELSILLFGGEIDRQD